VGDTGYAREWLPLITLSIVIPFRNGGAAFGVCLQAVAAARAACAGVAETELIAVDDGSTDGSAALPRAAGANVLATPAPGGHGPAAARNLGARAATGDYVFFVDADVALHAGALRRAAKAFAADPTLEAVFGSYDDAPAEQNLLSQYKNLFHHYVHQHAQAQAATFWTGCGAMRLSTYRALGGLDAQTYRRPSIEDIDLGYRLRRRGGEIRLLKDMQCVHLKHWTIGSLLRSDIVERGIPWTVLLWRESRARRTARETRSESPALLDLNLQTSNRVSVALAALLALAAAGLPLAPWSWPALVVVTAALLALNWRLYAFFAQRRGWGFAVACIPWHWLYYLYNSLSFSLGTLRYWLNGTRPLREDGALHPADDEAVLHQPAAGDSRQRPG
jgi:glycosyltransferase involved in cell wall biosynthesis